MDAKGVKGDKGIKGVSFFSRILDFIAPRSCCICGSRLSMSEEALCTVCDLHLPRTDFCQQAEDNEMARMFWGLIPINRCAALFYYENHSQTAGMLYDLKYRQRPEIGTIMGRMMADEMTATAFFNDIDALIPIPLSQQRQRQRGYNQSTEIAKGISERTRIPVIEKAVKRQVFVESQTKKSFWERRDNVEGVFQLVDPAIIAGKHLLVIDDVMTTGATITACARELLKSEGVRISVLTLAFTKS